MVRAERDSVLFDAFMERNLVSVGWHEAGDIRHLPRPEMERALRAGGSPGPDAKQGASVLSRFVRDMAIGDMVTTYDSGGRVYAVGTVRSDAHFTDAPLAHPRFEGHHPFVREVEWTHQIGRDTLSQAARNSLGFISTLFQPSEAAQAELLHSGDAAPAQDPEPPESEGGLDLETLEQQAREATADLVARLTDRQMEHLVAGLLRAMGYKTRVTPVGPDLGKDVIASKDGLGFESPRIFVEVKHRLTTRIDAPTLRAFAHTLGEGDRGLFVSTGGFTKEARYEAERARNAVQLLTLEELITELVDRYELLDQETRQMIPLAPVYWPLQ